MLLASPNPFSLQLEEGTLKPSLLEPAIMRPLRQSLQLWGPIKTPTQYK